MYLIAYLVGRVISVQLEFNSLQKSGLEDIKLLSLVLCGVNLQKHLQVNGLLGFLLLDSNLVSTALLVTIVNKLLRLVLSLSGLSGLMPL